MKKHFFFILVLLQFLPAFAQVFKLGDVSLKEVEETKHPFDKYADAAYLYKKGKTYFTIINRQILIVTEVAVRIKIYTKAGYEYANMEIPYYAGRGSQKVSFSDACTYNLVNGAVEKTKLRSEGKFEEEIVDNFKLKKITLPNVKEGSVIEYKYTVSSPYYFIISDWHFQHEIPTNVIEYELAIPEYLGYHKYLKGNIKVNSANLPKRTGHGGYFYENPTFYTAKNVKALKDEEYVNNIENYMSVLKHELATIQFPGEVSQFFASDWHTLISKIYEDESFSKELNLKSYFEDDIRALLKDVPQEKKIDTIYSFVRDRMTYNDVESEFCGKGVKKAYKDKSGNSAEINLMLTAILRYAGIKANPVLVSTRDNGEPTFPSIKGFNYVVCAVEVDKGQVLLDATSKNLVPGLLPVRALNWVGRVIDAKGNIFEIDIMPKNKSIEYITVTGKIDSEGKITGRAKNQYINHSAYLYREVFGKEHKEKYIEELEKRHQGIEINEYLNLNIKDLKKPVGDDYTFVHNSLTDVIGNKIFLSPLLCFREKENPFTAEEREYPIDFIFPHQDRYLISLTIPDGYVIETLPAPINYVMDENIGSFKYNLKNEGNVIQVNVMFEINFPNVSQKYYPDLKAFYAKVIEKQNEKIILRKA